MTFTESDAANDGLIKREVGREMAKVAKTQNPQMFQHFERVCEEVGRAPADVFGEMAVRSLNSEEYADNVLASEVNMGQIKADEIRMEDVKYVKELSEELGLNQQEKQKDPIDELINQRIRTVTQSPLDNLRNGQENPEGANGEVLRHMESLQTEINRLQQKIEGEDVETTTQDTTTEHNEQSVDDLFGDSDDTEDEQPTEQDGQIEDIELGEAEEAEVTPEPEPEPEEGPTDAEIEEALEGTGSNVDDAWEEEEPEVPEADEEIPEDNDDVYPMFTSEDGEEE